MVEGEKWAALWGKQKVLPITSLSVNTKPKKKKSTKKREEERLMLSRVVISSGERKTLSAHITITYPLSNNRR